MKFHISITTKSILLIFLWLAYFSIQAQNVYFPPEFEKQEGLLLTWDYNDSRNPITAAIAKAVQPSAKVWIIYYPGQAPMDTTEIRNYLRDHGVPDDGVSLIPAWSETLWIRDYGPFTGYSKESTPYQRIIKDAGYSAYGRPKDDSIPTQLANLWNVPASNINLDFEGGNILLDGLGRGWGSTRIYSQNPGYSQSAIKQIFEEEFGLTEMMFLEALVNSGGGIWCHVDMFMKILDHETIMISKYPDFVPDYGLVESFALALGQMTNSLGRNYKIVRIPAPPKADGTWAVTQNDEMRTYTNSIIINDAIVVPSYNLPEYDSVAREIYEENMPGYRIEMVDASPLTPLYGALHCITKEVTMPDYLRIEHPKIVGMQDYQGHVTVTAMMDCNVPVDSAMLFYRKARNTPFTRIDMIPGCPIHQSIITNLSPRDTVDYYLKTASNGIVVCLPPPAPNGYYTFWFDPYVGFDEQNSTKLGIEISPNPNSGIFDLKIDVLNDVDLEVVIYNNYGQLIYSNQVENRYSTFQLADILNPGIYFLSVINSGELKASTKLIIHK
jgi:agmatine/peptidylarginine deiminase